MHPPSSSEGRSSSHRKVVVVINVITICRSRGDRDQDQHKAWGPKRSSPTLPTEQLNHSIPSFKVHRIPYQTQWGWGPKGDGPTLWTRVHPPKSSSPHRKTTVSISRGITSTKFLSSVHLDVIIYVWETSIRMTSFLIWSAGSDIVIKKMSLRYIVNWKSAVSSIHKIKLAFRLQRITNGLQVHYTKYQSKYQIHCRRIVHRSLVSFVSHWLIICRQWQI